MHTRDGDGGSKALCRAVVLHIPTEHTDPCMLSHDRLTLQPLSAYARARARGTGKTWDLLGSAGLVVGHTWASSKLFSQQAQLSLRMFRI